MQSGAVGSAEDVDPGDGGGAAEERRRGEAARVARRRGRLGIPVLPEGERALRRGRRRRRQVGALRLLRAVLRLPLCAPVSTFILIYTIYTVYTVV